MSPEDTVEKINKIMDAIYSMYAQNAIDKDTFHKMLMKVSYEYASNLMFEDAFIVLGVIEPSYFDNQLLKQLKEDVTFNDLCIKYAKLIDVHLNLSTIYLPNMPSAQA